ncbi:MAG: hypothetical protein Q9224_003995 [Gallowayella concinna]
MAPWNGNHYGQDQELPAYITNTMLYPNKSSQANNQGRHGQAAGGSLMPTNDVSMVKLHSKPPPQPDRLPYHGIRLVAEDPRLTQKQTSITEFRPRQRDTYKGEWRSQGE